MPTYEYECSSCSYRFERYQKMTDQPLEICPKCSKEVKRLISSGAGIIFKGSGFYATDYRKTPKPQAPKACPKAKEGCNGCQAENK